MQQATSLFLVQFPAGMTPVQVDDFPPKTPRSCEGALHIRPASTKKITAHEAKHLESKGIRFRTVKKLAPPPVARAEATTTAQPVASKPAPQPEASNRRRRGNQEDPKPE